MQVAAMMIFSEETDLNLWTIFRPVTVAIVLMAALSGAAQDANSQEKSGDPKSAKEDAGIPVPPETNSVTKHDITLGGQVIHYTATAGNLLIRDDHDKPNASMFYVAYTQDGADPKTRPVTFF